MLKMSGSKFEMGIPNACYLTVFKRIMKYLLSDVNKTHGNFMENERMKQHTENRNDLHISPSYYIKQFLFPIRMRKQTSR